MSDGNGEYGGTEDGALPEAKLAPASGFSLVWLIPIIAALIGGWIAWRTYAESGPTITITFQTAEGLEAGKTQVKFKDLTVGLVQSIELAEDLSHVIVTAELTPGANRYLRKGTRFWVVRPQFTAGRATGLGTLLSGAYVAVDPVMKGKQEREFTGLETQPVITTDAAGTVFTLRSKSLGSAQIGSPIYFRKISVGTIVSYELSDDGNSAYTRIFVEAPHDKRVNTNTRFWDASGLDLTVDAQGLQLDTESVISLLIGGIAFDTPYGAEGEPLSEDTILTLYPNRQASLEKSYALKERYLLHFSGSVEGLVPGSLVVFRGIRIGEVLDVRLQLNWKESQVRIPVVIEIEPERIEWLDEEDLADEQSARIDHLVRNGFRGQLGTGNILIGRLQVELDLHDDVEPGEVIYGGLFPEIPTIATPLEHIQTSIATIVKNVERIPLDEIGIALRDSLTELRTTLQNVSRLSAGFDEDVMPSLTATLTNLETTSQNLNQLIASDSPIPVELQRAIGELGRAAQSARLLADYLERHPEALIRGKSDE